MSCEQFASDFSVISDVPNTGTCAVVGGTRDYANLLGSGTISGSADLSQLPAKLSDVLELSLRW